MHNLHTLNLFILLLLLVAAISALTPLKLLPIDFTSTLPEEFFEYVTKPLDGVGGPITHPVISDEQINLHTHLEFLVVF